MVTAHIAPSSTSVDSYVPYHGDDKVALGNGNVLHISRIGTFTVKPNLKLKDVLIVPHLKKKLLSVSKLDNDYPIDFLFCWSFFSIQYTNTKSILATRKHKDVLFMLHAGPQALVVSVSSPIKASFEL